MKNIRCYGKKTNVPKQEKSFIRNFFEGNKSSESSLFAKSSDDVLEKDSLEDNKENVTENIESPSLFGNTSVKSISPENESFSESFPKTNTVPNKRNKKIKKKRAVRRKPKRVFPYSTKFYRSLQPRWSEIYRHDLTIERQGTNRTHCIVSSRYQNYSKKSRRTRKHVSVSSVNNKLKRNKQRIFSSSNSSGDIFIPKESKQKSFKDLMSQSHNACTMKQKLSIAPSTSISELSKQFQQNVNLGNSPVAQEFPLYNEEDFYIKGPLNKNKCQKSFIEFKEFREIQSSASEHLNVSKSISQKNNTSKKLNPASFIHSSHVLQKSSVGKFMTSTPITQKTIYVHNPLNIHSSHDNSCGSGALTSKVSHGILYSDIMKEESLNFLDKEIKDSEFYPKETTSVERRTSVSKNILSDLVTSNKSMTLPEKKSKRSVSSIHNRSLFVSHDSPNMRQSAESAESAKIKLLKLCNQDSIATFADIYDWNKRKVKKIGEGSYGEVFMVTSGKSSCVLKIIPIAEQPGEEYQGLSNVLSEVKITKCLSELRNNKRNNAKNFIKMNSVSVVVGLYPPIFLQAWDNYRETKSSYNDRPDIYNENQMFVLLELEYGGNDMSACVLRNALEAESVLKQVATSLAVAEEEYNFEHRDLHLGNILIKRNRKKFMTYKLRGKDISFECHGVQATLIDFTLSRLHEEGYVYFNDLAEDVSLFEQSGDYQFDVYKNMRNVLGNQWFECCFLSNILWLKFLCKKFKEFEYSRPSTVIHKKGLKAIDKFNEQLTSCNSAVECLTVCGITPLYFERSNTDSELTKKSIFISRNSIQKSKLSICH